MKKNTKEIERLLSRSSEFYLNLIRKKYPLFNYKRPIVIFGSADMGKLYLKLFQKNNIKVENFCDNDKLKQGLSISGIKILSPRELKQKYKKDTQIVITSIYEEEIREQLLKMGFINVFSFKYFAFFNPRKFNNPHWKNSINFLLKHKSEILECFSLFEDPISIKTFTNVVKYRLLEERKLLKEILEPKSKEYFDKVIIKLDHKEVFIDGGAYTGDTLVNFIKETKGRFGEVYAFEPDSKSFKKLKQTKKRLKDRRINVVNVGLGDNNSIVKFSDEGNLGSRIDKDAKKEIKIVNIDSFMNGKDITFIKLDIEGAEKSAILGARKTIKEKKPKLAVCIYHLPRDLYELPLLVKKINPNYKFFLRHYTEFIYDTVLYAV